MGALAFTVEGPPQAKKRPRVVRHEGRVQTYTPSSTVAYEATVRAHALRAMAVARWERPIESDRFNVGLTLYFGDARRRDVDNVAKAILDALIGVVFVDDFHVTSLHVERFLSQPCPRASVGVERFTCEALAHNRRGWP